MIQHIKKLIAFCGLFASVSPVGAYRLSELDIIPAMQKVADWQIANFAYSAITSLNDNGVGAWTNATLYLGMSRWAEISTNHIYSEWLMNIGTILQWKVPANLQNDPRSLIYHADELCIIQLYEALYQRYQQPVMLEAARQRLDLIIQNPPNGSMVYTNKQSWTWCDALFMAPASFLGLWRVTGNENYLNFAHEHFVKSYGHLYHFGERLFYRDDSYFDRREANGKPVFWGRGNGWVAAGLANILKILPKGHAMRPYYESLFRSFVPRLAGLQGATGFWHASLLDPESYPAPETSATALITYAIAYGVNSGLLPAAEYAPVVERAWKAMITAMNGNGKLGWIQPPGADPKNVTAEMTAVYGVGAFLMAGSEIIKGDLSAGNEDFDRSNWTITTSYVGVPDAAVDGDKPEYIIDGNIFTAFLFIKPGRTYEGVTGPADYIPSFTIDMKEKKEFDYFVYRHRTLGNTNETIRARGISFYGKKSEENDFVPIIENVVINHIENRDEIRVKFDKVEYRYVQLIITDWNRVSGYTVQISEFNMGLEDLLTPPTEQDSYSVRIIRGEGITHVTPETGNVTGGDDFVAEFALAANYGNPTVTGGNAVIEGNTIRFPSVTSDVEVVISASKLTGVFENLHRQVKVYPNPVMSGQMLTIDLSSHQQSLVKIIGADGKLLMQKTIADETVDILMNYAPGVYFLTIIQGGVETTHKVTVYPGF